MSAHFSHDMPFGAELAENGVRFRLWAPGEHGVTLVLESSEGERMFPMRPCAEGWFELTTDAARAGNRYRYRLSDGSRVPDPVSRFQPEGVHGPSEVIAPQAYSWATNDWNGRPWCEAVLYEIHLGAFTPGGDFDGARRRLDYLADLGVSALELMPLADFDGRRNWGYDGVLPFAPSANYGKPDALKRLIDAAHERGLMMFLDVVYNHFGPAGNHLARYAPGFFSDRHQTPWGDAIDFTRREVREFFIHNALYWLEEYRFDGLRLDAVDQIYDPSPTHILSEIAASVREQFRDRYVHLVLENDDNAAHYLERKEAPRACGAAPLPGFAGKGGVSSLPLAREARKGESEGDSAPRLYSAQWNDDFHHAAHVLATGEDDGYYVDYAERPVAALARALAEGFVYQGEYSQHRDRARGESSAHLPPLAFVNFLQNHDQISNRACGERITELASRARLRLLYTLMFLSPSIPLLFMGEEWAAETPFLFFCDFDAELGAAVREGRRNEFRRFAAFRDPKARERIPDPTREETFLRSRLNWDEPAQPLHAGWQAFIAGLIAVRRSELIPRLNEFRSGRYEIFGEKAFIVTWPYAPGRSWRLVANPGNATVKASPPPGRVVYASDERVDELPPWSVRVTVDE